MEKTASLTQWCCYLVTTLSANIEAAVPTEAYVPFDCFITTTDIGDHCHLAGVSVTVRMACLCGDRTTTEIQLLGIHAF